MSKTTRSTGPLREYVPGEMWLAEYPVRFAGIDLVARTTVVRLADGLLWVHSPGPLSNAFEAELEALGRPGYVIAPGTFHFLHAADFKQRYPAATLWVCPGIETKAPQMPFEFILGDRPPDDWAEQIDQVLVRGVSPMREVAFFHRASRTLVLTDLVENIGDESGDVDWKLRFWWKAVFHMWNHPKPAPEYQLGYKDKSAVRQSLERILAWDFERVILAHGELIEQDAQRVVREAWARPLSFAE